MKVVTDLKTRGCQDILIAVTDGLKGMSEALAAIYPATTLQTCLVHLLRHSLDFANWKERKPLAAALRPVYTAPSADAAAAALDAFEQGPWGSRFPTVAASWRRVWSHVIPFFAFPPSIRRVIYPTNALESVHARLRKIIKTRGHFPTDEAATKLIWLALRNITAGWWKAANYWHLAMNQFAIRYEDRFTIPGRRMDPAHGHCRRRGRTDRAHTHHRQRALHTKNLILPKNWVGFRVARGSRVRFETTVE
jgi:putative transposase